MRQLGALVASAALLLPAPTFAQPRPADPRPAEAPPGEPAPEASDASPEQPAAAPSGEAPAARSEPSAAAGAESSSSAPAPNAPAPNAPAPSAPAPNAPAPATPASPPELRLPSGAATPRVAPDLRPPLMPGSLGVRYTLEHVEVKGNSRTRSRVVLRYLPFESGDIIDVDDPALELARYRLLGTGFFREVHFSLRKGSRRGWVVLTVDVVERNTIIVNDLWLGLAAEANPQGDARRLIPYAGIDAAETNLAGTGITLGSAIGVGPDQYALRVRFLDPAFLGGRWMTNVSLLYNDARDHFGVRHVIAPGLQSDVPNSVPVDYTRFGGTLGMGRDLAVATQLWVHYRLESIEAQVPTSASHVRGGFREPIQFDILPDRSVLSTVRAALHYDTRDHPYLPSRGWLLSLQGELSLGPTGSTYRYQKLDALTSRWWTLPWARHVLRAELFVGAIAGDAPFFEQYYVGDFSDFLPDRVLDLNFDRRPAPDFLGSAIAEVRYGEYAARLGLEYRVPLYRGRRSVFQIDLFASAGAYSVFTDRDLATPNRRYQGLARWPVDLTGNLGFRMDTSAGGFVFAFSNVLGLLPVRGGTGP